MKNTDPTINHVSDTAFWVASYRAEESDKTDGLFKDPLAKKLAGERGVQMSRDAVGSRFTAWTLVIRTVIIDNFIQKLIEEKAIDMVVNLGAGLDTRPYRLNLPADFQWVEADYPHVIEFKNQQLKEDTPKCRLDRVAVDLADTSSRDRFFSEMQKRSARTLILTEGVLIYLTEEQVGELARALSTIPNFRLWIVDYLAPQVKRYFNNKKRKQQMKNAPIQFFPKDWFGFFHNYGWKPKEMRYLFEESLRLGRPMPLPWIARVFVTLLPAKLRQQQMRLSGYFLMEPVLSSQGFKSTC